MWHKCDDEWHAYKLFAIMNNEVGKKKYLFWFV